MKKCILPPKMNTKGEMRASPVQLTSHLPSPTPSLPPSYQWEPPPSSSCAALLQTAIRMQAKGQLGYFEVRNRPSSPSLHPSLPSFFPSSFLPVL